MNKNIIKFLYKNISIYINLKICNIFIIRTKLYYIDKKKITKWEILKDLNKKISQKDLWNLIPKSLIARLNYFTKITLKKLLVTTLNKYLFIFIYIKFYNFSNSSNLTKNL